MRAAQAVGAQRLDLLPGLLQRTVLFLAVHAALLGVTVLATAPAIYQAMGQAPEVRSPIVQRKQGSEARARRRAVLLCSEQRSGTGTESLLLGVQGLVLGDPVSLPCGACSLLS